MPVPGEREETVRESIKRLLREGPATAKDLSTQAHVSEKDVAGHLEHLEKSLRHGHERLAVHPASCIACGFEFKDRRKLTRPGSCPECRSTRIDPPTFRITSEPHE